MSLPWNTEFQLATCFLGLALEIVNLSWPSFSPGTSSELFVARPCLRTGRQLELKLPLPPELMRKWGRRTVLFQNCDPAVITMKAGPPRNKLTFCIGGTEKQSKKYCNLHSHTHKPAYTHNMWKDISLVITSLVNCSVWTFAGLACAFGVGFF